MKYRRSRSLSHSLSPRRHLRSKTRSPRKYRRSRSQSRSFLQEGIYVPKQDSRGNIDVQDHCHVHYLQEGIYVPNQRSPRKYKGSMSPSCSFSSKKAFKTFKCTSKETFKIKIVVNMCTKVQFRKTF